MLAPVQTDKTKDAMPGDPEGARGHPRHDAGDGEELADAKNSQVLTLPGQWETMAAVGARSRRSSYGLADDYYKRYPAVFGS